MNNSKTFILALLLSGCATTPPHNLQQDIQASAIPQQWMFAHADQKNGQAEWWRDYGDPALNNLIAQSLAHNQNLAAAGYAWQKSRLARAPTATSAKVARPDKTTQPASTSTTRPTCGANCASPKITRAGKQKPAPKTCLPPASVSSATSPTNTCKSPTPTTNSR